MDEMYFVKTVRRPTGEGTWDVLKVEVFRRDDDGETKIGEYGRNYPRISSTFHAFKQGDREFARYSPHYTATRVMSLPDCTDIGCEEPAQFGFCPVDFYVPSSVWDEEDDTDTDRVDGQFGFVAGCVWGDDSSWKIQYLDLSRVSEGIVKGDDRFGYIELASDQDLKHAIDATCYDPEDGVFDISI